MKENHDQMTIFQSLQLREESGGLAALHELFPNLPIGPHQGFGLCELIHHS